MADRLEATFCYSSETVRHRNVLSTSDIFRMEPVGSPIPPLYVRWAELQRASWARPHTTISSRSNPAGP